MSLVPQKLAPCLVGVALSACVDGTSTGNPTLDPPRDNGTSAELGGQCEAESSEVLGESDVTSLGFSAADVLAFVAGEHSAELTWNTQDFVYGPEQGTGTLHVDVTPRGPAQLVHYVPKQSGSGIALEFAEPCGDALDLDLSVHVHSDGGALDERFDTTVSVTSQRLARIAKTWKPSELAGSFAVGSAPSPGFTLAQLDLALDLTPYALAGTLRTTFEMRGSDGVSAAASGRLPLASFGPPSCEAGRSPVPMEAAVAGFSALDVVAAFDAAPPTAVRIDGGAASPVTFAPLSVGEWACAQLASSYFDPSSPLGTLALYATLAARSDDGRLHASWPVVVLARPADDGALEQISVSFDFARLPGSGDVAARYGVTLAEGVTAPEDAAASLDLSLLTGEPLYGRLDVHGWARPNCSSEPMVDPSGGVSSPGCPGAEPIPLLDAEFGPR
jgi:hypothetical protein